MPSGPIITAYDLASKALASIKRRPKEEATVSQYGLPPGWDEERVRRTLAHYDNQGEDDALIEEKWLWRPARR